jgi:hypothetical protein
MPLVRGHCPIASIGCQIALTKIVQGWMGSKTDGCLHACMHARPPALAARRRRVGLQSVCHRTAGSVIHARPQHRRRPRRPTPSALTVRHPASQDDARVPWTARTTTTCLRTDNDERSAALCPCMPTAPSRDRSIERSSRLSVNQST